MTKLIAGYHAQLASPKPLITVARNSIIDPVTQSLRQPSEHAKGAPGPTQVNRNSECRIGTIVYAIIFNQHESIIQGCRDIVLGNKTACGGALRGSKPVVAGSIPFQDETDRAVTQVTDSVKQDDG